MQFPLRLLQYVDQFLHPLELLFLLETHAGAVPDQVDFSGRGKHLRDERASASEFSVVGGTGPAGREKIVHFIRTYLQIASSCLCQECGIRFMEHFH